MAKHPPVEGQFRLFEPASNWHPPTGSLPMLSGIEVAIDTEVKDNGLEKEIGPGWVHLDGYLLGASVAWGNNSLYVPTRHPETENRPVEEVIAWLDYLLRNCRCVFFSSGFDMGWLRASGSQTWPERMEDAQIQAVMLDENYDVYSLDRCCERLGIPGKDEAQLNDAAAAYGIAPRKGSIKHGLWRLPARHVGPYAEQDAVATLMLYRAQKPLLEAEGTTGAYRTEIELVEVVHHMRKRGIQVSIDGAEKAQRHIQGTVNDVLTRIETPPVWHRRATIEDLRSPMRLAEIFDAEGIQYDRTPKTGLPSFTKDFLTKCTHPVAKDVMRVRQLYDLKDKFLGTYILQYHHRGRIHAEIHQLKDEAGGAKTNRLSYSNPPMQQMPSRDPELAPVVRGVFEPEAGCDWLAADYKSQEPRLTTHFAAIGQQAAAKYRINMLGVDDLVDYYRNDPNPDPYTFTAKILGLTRKETKDLTQGLTYRMQAKKLAWHMNVPEATAKRMFDEFHAKVPYIQGLAKLSEALAHERGYIRMIDGARRHFPFWQPAYTNGVDDRESYARREAAEAKWPGMKLKRAFAYQAMNSLVQGSAARQIKRSLVASYRAGYLPLVSMHDENDYLVTCERDCEAIGEIMRDAVQLVVPVTIDLEVGSTWGNAKHEYRGWFARRAA